MKTQLLIDGDIVAYQSAISSEVEVKWGDDLWTLHSHENEAKEMLDNTIAKMKKNLKADSIVVAITDKINFRKDVLPTYKDNRKQRRKPIVLGILRSYLIKKYNAIFYTGLEADDVLGILATKPSKYDKVIVSIDKDFNQIPTKISRDGETITSEVTTQEADLFHMMQTLAGDSSDGYSGCPKIGMVTAKRLLGKKKTVESMWETVVETYKKAGLEERDALQQARVARILRHGEYDTKTGEVKLWETSQYNKKQQNK